MGVLYKVRVEGNEDELFCFRLEDESSIARILGGEFGEPPEGRELVPWFSCILLKIVLEKKDVVVSKGDFTGMAAVLAGFMSETLSPIRLHSADAVRSAEGE